MEDLHPAFWRVTSTLGRIYRRGAPSLPRHVQECFRQLLLEIRTYYVPVHCSLKGQPHLRPELEVFVDRLSKLATRYETMGSGSCPTVIVLADLLPAEGTSLAPCTPGPGPAAVSAPLSPPTSSSPGPGSSCKDWKAGSRGGNSFVSQGPPPRRGTHPPPSLGASGVCTASLGVGVRRAPRDVGPAGSSSRFQQAARGSAGGGPKRCTDILGLVMLTQPHCSWCRFN